MPIDLTGTRAIVSGSTAGIGFGVARGLAEAGAEVIINGRTGERVEAALAELRQRVPRATFGGIAADLSTPEGVQGFISQAGEADILVNNLGIFEPAPFEEITDDDWQRFFDTNVMSGLRLSRHYLPRMVQRGWGRVVFISSASAFQIPAGMIHYGVTKSAQLAISRGLAESVAGSGVTVNAVLPGPTRTEGVEKIFRDVVVATGLSQEELEKQYFAQPSTSILGRMETAEEVANLVVYICSRAASATTGATLRADGGMVRTIA